MKKVSVNVSVDVNNEYKLVIFPASMFAGSNGISFTYDKKNGKVEDFEITNIKPVKMTKQEWNKDAAAADLGFSFELFDNGKDGGLISTIQKISIDLDKAVTDGMIDSGVVMFKDFLRGIAIPDLPKKEEDPKFEETV